jgi:putative heme-binding domain-containing protein
MRLTSLYLLVMAAGTLWGQESQLPDEAEYGRRAFRANCTVCHGLEGDAVAGVHLAGGKFRRASSADDLIEIIRGGIPGTGMPPTELSKYEARSIVAYLRFMESATRSLSAPGDTVRGRTIFEGKGRCLDCHRVKGKGSRTGPDLTEIGSLRRAVDLEHSILEPNAEVLSPNRTVRLVTRDGATITGRLLNRDTFTIQVIDSKERLLSFRTENLKEFAFADQSPMPSYKGKLNSEELADLVNYLVSLKGIDAP